MPRSPMMLDDLSYGLQPKMGLWADIRTDISFTLGREMRGLGALFRCLSHDGLRVVCAYRLCRWLATKGKIGHGLASVVRTLSIMTTGCIVSRLAEIAPGLALPHGTGIVIGEGVRIGRNVIIYQNVTLGRSAQPTHLKVKIAPDEIYPEIGEGVTIYPGACISGPVHVGAGAVVGANSVVNRSVEAGAVVSGIPARVLREPLADQL
jgi:serine O-acetyltransferase